MHYDHINTNDAKDANDGGKQRLHRWHRLHVLYENSDEGIRVELVFNPASPPRFHGKEWL